jgi:hypothetical protein
VTGNGCLNLPQDFYVDLILQKAPTQSTHVVCFEENVSANLNVATTAFKAEKIFTCLFLKKIFLEYSLEVKRCLVKRYVR